MKALANAFKGEESSLVAVDSASDFGCLLQALTSGRPTFYTSPGRGNPTGYLVIRADDLAALKKTLGSKSFTEHQNSSLLTRRRHSAGGPDSDLQLMAREEQLMRHFLDCAGVTSLDSGAVPTGSFVIIRIERQTPWRARGYFRPTKDERQGKQQRPGPDMVDDLFSSDHHEVVVEELADLPLSSFPPTAAQTRTPSDDAKEVHIGESSDLVGPIIVEMMALIESPDANEDQKSELLRSLFVALGLEEALNRAEVQGEDVWAAFIAGAPGMEEGQISIILNLFQEKLTDYVKGLEGEMSSDDDPFPNLELYSDDPAYGAREEPTQIPVPTESSSESSKEQSDIQTNWPRIFSSLVNLTRSITEKSGVPSTAGGQADLDVDGKVKDTVGGLINSILETEDVDWQMDWVAKLLDALGVLPMTFKSGLCIYKLSVENFGKDLELSKELEVKIIKTYLEKLEQYWSNIIEKAEQDLKK